MSEPRSPMENQKPSQLVPIEYLVKGEKVNTDFNDGVLLELFRTVDEMSREERTVVKKYLRKFITNRDQWQSLQDEAQS